MGRGEGRVGTPLPVDDYTASSHKLNSLWKLSFKPNQSHWPATPGKTTSGTPVLDHQQGKCPCAQPRPQPKTLNLTNTTLSLSQYLPYITLGSTPPTAQPQSTVAHWPRSILVDAAMENSATRDTHTSTIGDIFFSLLLVEHRDQCS